jgi:hypothetical protein
VGIYTHPARTQFAAAFLFPLLLLAAFVAVWWDLVELIGRHLREVESDFNSITASAIADNQLSELPAEAFATTISRGSPGAAIAELASDEPASDEPASDEPASDEDELDDLVNRVLDKLLAMPVEEVARRSRGLSEHVPQLDNEARH